MKNLSPDLQSKNQLLRHLAASVRGNDYERFCTHTQVGATIFDTKTLASILNMELPLLLDAKHIPCLIKFIVGEDGYIDAVRSFLAEMAQVLSTEGMKLGVDFSGGEEDGTPYLLMCAQTAARAEDLYEPHAWKQCLPFLRVK